MKHVARMEKRESFSKIYVRNVLLERPRRRWEDNIKMDLPRIVCDDVGCINLPENRVQWLVF
jgi:hypothetical protein